MVEEEEELPVSGNAVNRRSDRSGFQLRWRKSETATASLWLRLPGFKPASFFFFFFLRTLGSSPEERQP